MVIFATRIPWKYHFRELLNTWNICLLFINFFSFLRYEFQWIQVSALLPYLVIQCPIMVLYTLSFACTSALIEMLYLPNCSAETVLSFTLTITVFCLFCFYLTYSGNIKKNLNKILEKTSSATANSQYDFPDSLFITWSFSKNVKPSLSYKNKINMGWRFYLTH